MQQSLWGLISGSLAVLNCLLGSWVLPHKMINWSKACVVLTHSILLSWVTAGSRKGALGFFPLCNPMEAPNFIFPLASHGGSQRVPNPPRAPGAPLRSCLDFRCRLLFAFSFQTPIRSFSLFFCWDQTQCSLFQGKLERVCLPKQFAFPLGKTTF